MLTDPYGYITWNGDTLPEGAVERTPGAVFLDAHIYLMNGFSAINVFGRYYAGGDIQNEVDDMVAGLRFLAQAPRVMRDRIAVTGGSWGGFESLYASAHAPDGAVPRVGVALYPPSDFQEFMHYLTVDIPAMDNEEKRNQYISFFAPFVERINAGTKGDQYINFFAPFVERINTGTKGITHAGRARTSSRSSARRTWCCTTSGTR